MLSQGIRSKVTRTLQPVTTWLGEPRREEEASGVDRAGHEGQQRVA